MIACKSVERLVEVGKIHRKNFGDPNLGQMAKIGSKISIFVNF